LDEALHHGGGAIGRGVVANQDFKLVGWVAELRQGG
jgi:hypothetical protein